jgi:hypothetical protein
LIEVSAIGEVDLLRLAPSAEGFIDAYELGSGY